VERIIKIVISVLSLSLGFSNVIGEMPSDFEYNQSTMQQFYFIIDANIDGTTIEEGDWIAAFKGDLCVGAREWVGSYTDIPVMGDDGEEYSAGYMLPGEYPTFKIYKLSEENIYNAQPSENVGFLLTDPLGLLEMVQIQSLDVVYDCADVLGGLLVFDDCGVCDGDGSDDIGCGCFEDAALTYYMDVDLDGFGSGLGSDFCLVDVPDGYVLDGSDIDDDCFSNAYQNWYEDADQDGLGYEITITDLCTDITELEGSVLNADDLEPNCATNDTDECGVCAGDNSTCNGCMDENAWNYCSECLVPTENCIYIPDEFHFSQSTSQAFYFVIEAEISEISLSENEDWIGTFKGDICVGSWPWEGTFTSVPAMGNDGSELTNSYLENGDYPTFKIFDASENTYFEAEAINTYNQEQSSSASYDGWTNFGFYEVERLHALVPDCINILEGDAYIDDCGECVGGTTNIEDGWAKDCFGDCFGDAYLDNCSICSEGNTQHIADIDDSGCGCFQLAPEDYWYDSDSDGLGSGDLVSLCLQDVSSVWVQNDDDIDPFCSSNDTDDCGVCAGNNTNMDCAGICFGDSVIDECDVCGGNGASCLAPVAEAQEVDLFEDNSLPITLSAYDPNGYPITEYTIITTPLNGSLSGVFPSVTYTPSLNFNGSDNFQFTVSTDEYTSEPAMISITIIPVNDAPVAYNIQQTLDENQTIEFNLIGFDVDGDALSFEIVSGPYAGEAFLVSDTASYTPNINYFGVDSFDFIANDGELNSNDATALFTIQGINNPPVVELILAQETFEDEPLSVNINATDADDDYLVYSATVDNNAFLIIDGSLITVIPDENYNGSLLISVNVTDGLEVTFDQFSVNVISVNDPPVIEHIPSQVTEEDISISINLVASDIEGDELIFSAGLLDFASFSFVGSELIVTPNENYFGQFTVELFVSDNEDSDSVNFSINVNEVNDPPELSFIDNQTGIEDLDYSLELFAADIENNEIIFTATTDGNSQASIIENNLTITPNGNFNGDINVSVFASDGYEIDSQSFILSIASVNDSPELSLINDITTDEDTSTSFRITAFDIDGDMLTYTAVAPNVVFEYDGDLITVIPDQDINGNIQVEVTVSDEELVVSTVFNLVINEVNDIPEVLSEIGNIELNQNNEDYIIDLTNHFYDVENQFNLQFSIFENHPAIIASIENNMLTLATIDNMIGSGFISITASDNVARAVASIDFEVNVIAVNQPPVVNDMFLSNDEDVVIEFTLDVNDESPELYVSIVSQPIHGEITGIDGIAITYLSYENYYGNDEIIFSISDGELSSELTVQLEINSINDAPYFITTSLENEFEFSEFSQLIEYEDVDTDNSLVNLSLLIGPSWVSLEANYLRGFPLGSDSGIYTIILQVDDGMDSNILEFDLTIDNQNEAPNVNNLNATCEEDGSIDFSIFASDNDGDELTYSIGEAQNGLISGSAPDLVYTPNLNFSGNDYIIFTASDGIDTSNEGTISITVLSVNDAPTAGNAIFEVSGNEYEFDLSDYVSDLEDDELIFASVPPSGSDTLETVFGGLVIPNGDHSFTYEHPEGISDADFLLYKVNDGLAESAVSMITFNLYGRSWSRNNPPSAFDDEVEILEDNSSQLTLVGFDVFNEFLLDGSESVTITQQPEYGILGDITLNVESSESGPLAQWTTGYTPDLNFNGTDEIRYIVNNPNNQNGDSEEGIITITVNTVNDLPIFTNIESINFDEDQNTVIEIQFSDVDNDLILVIEENENIDIQVTSTNTNSAQLYITADENYSGSSIVSISVTEDRDDGIQVSQDILVVVDAVNDSPVLSNIPDISINEDESATFQIDASDIDFVSFSFAISLSNNFSTELLGNQLTLVPSENWNGEEDFTITVEDNYGLEDSQSFSVSVLSVNDSPIADNQSQELIEDGVRLIYPSGSDIDSNQLTFAISEQPENGTITVDGWVFRYEPILNFNGEDSFTYVANDGINISEPAIVMLAISPVNDSPIFGELNLIELEEDSDTDILLSAVDIDGDLLSFSIVNSVNGIGATLVANVLSIFPEANYFGSGNIVLKVSDGGSDDWQSVDVNILPVNDPPIMHEIDDIILSEGAGAELQLSALDIDSENLIFTASSDNDVEIYIDDTMLILTTPSDAGNSEIIIEVMVSDGEYINTETFSVFTENLNDPPSTVSLSLEVSEDSQLSIAPQGSDMNGDLLTYTFVSSTNNGSLEFIEGLFLYVPDSNFVGTDSFTYIANDGEYDSQISTVDITVNNVNDQPMLMAIDDYIVEEGQSVEVEINAVDIDGDALTYSAISDGNIIVNIIGSTLTISPLDENYNGDITVNVLISDGQLENSDSFILSYLPINDIPQISLIPNANINEDGVFIHLLNAIDLDEDEIIFSVELDGNAIASIEGNLLTITPDQNYNGGIDATISVSDGEYTAFTSFALEVIPVNDAPSISIVEPQVAFEDIEFQFNIEVEDVDSDNHLFSVSMDTTFVTYSLVNNSILVQPMENWYGEVLVNISASDGEFTTTQSFTVGFEPVNDSPLIISDAIVDATEDLLYEYQMQIDDPDDTSFYFSLISGPDGMSLSETGLITWLPVESILTSGLIAIVVWDTNEPTTGQDFPAYQEFIINVNSVNDAPIITSNPIITAIEDIDYTYQVTATDIDSDYFTFNLGFAPEGMTISNNGLIEWLPTEGVFSSEMIQVNVSDNNPINPIISTQQFLVVVTPVNDAPFIISIADSSATTGEEYTYQVIVEDPDDDQFIYFLFNNPDEMQVNETGLVTWLPNLPGIYGPITLAVSDGGENDVQPVQELFIVVVEAPSPLITMEFELPHEANLISFMGIPQDSTVTGIFAPLVDNALSLIGNQEATTQLTPGSGDWVGSLTSIKPTSGYWLKLVDVYTPPPVPSFIIQAYPTDPYINYELIQGVNLISYVGTNKLGISEAIPDEFENRFYVIIGEGVATAPTEELGWVGSLTEFENLEGYWVGVDEDMDFNWNIPEDLVRESVPKVINKKIIPSEFMYTQSTQQAFYFVKDANIDGFDLLEDDWLIAYHNNTVIGGRQWNGPFTDVPAMGVDGFDDTFGYIESDLIPNFKLFRESTGELIDMMGEDITPWKNNEVTFISLSRKEEIPNNVVLNPAYPNPFNPSTQLSFDIVHEGLVNLSVYDINGRLIQVLKNNEASVGNHLIEWNAESYASGIYFVQLVTNNLSLSQKLILVK
jgi:hypothetical protein